MSEVFDIAIVGLGPAGRALASRCVARGMTTLALDPDPDRVWEQTLALWADQLPEWLSHQVCASRIDSPTLVGRTAHRIDRPYVVLDNTRLRRELPLGGATVEKTVVPDSLLPLLQSRARLVVDCRGARPGGATGQNGTRSALQVAYGIVLESGDARPALDGHDALFMDWRTDYAPDDVGEHTFLYAIPLGGDRMVLEETALATRTLHDPEALRDRLHSRLWLRGVDATALAEPLDVELVRFPLRPRVRRTPGLITFGTAAGHGHSATGYSIGAVLEAVERAVDALELMRAPRRPRPGSSSALHVLGLRALLRLDEAATTDLFEAFGRIDGSRQRAFVDSDVPPRHVLGSMAAMWWRMPAASKLRMIRATLR